MAARVGELLYSQQARIKEAKRLDGISSNTSNDSSIHAGAVGGSEVRTQKGVKIRARNPKIIKHTKLADTTQKANKDNSELKSDIIKAIREELRHFRPSNNTQEEITSTIYIPLQGSGEVETHIVSDTSITEESSSIDITLEKLKKLKGEK